MTPVRVIRTATRLVRAYDDASEKVKAGDRRGAVSVIATALVGMVLSLGLFAFIPGGDWLAQIVAEEGVEQTVALGLDLWDALVGVVPVLVGGGALATKWSMKRAAYSAEDIIADRDDSAFVFEVLEDDDTIGTRKLSNAQALAILRDAVANGEGS
jgi:hypothetical protein